MNIDVISPRRIVEELDKAVAGQTEAKEMLAIVAYNHLMRYYNDVEGAYSVPPPRFTALLTGPTGTGKTLLIDSLSQILDLPVIKIDAQHLSLPGFVGLSITDYLDQLRDKYARSPLADRLDRALIFIDEIDKLGPQKSSTQHSDHNSAVQASLLTAIDGTVLHSERSRSNTHNTHNMLFILAGAFETSYDGRHREANSIGFNSQVGNETAPIHYREPLSMKELEEAGIMRELLGRISVTASVYKLTKEEIRWALENVYQSMLEQFATLFYLNKQDLPFKDSDIDKIVDELYNSRYGMRHARAVLFKYFKQHMLDLNGISMGTSQTISIYEGDDLDDEDK